METLVGLAPLIIMFAIFYFLLIRPQQKRQKERTAMLDSLKKGDNVVTLGGLHGVIAEIDDETLVLKVAENTKLKFERSAASYVKNND
jgi:preprotein translocase subunit YajC